MKNQRKKNKMAPKKMGILIALLLAAVALIVALFVLLPLGGREPAGEDGPGSDAGAPADQPTVMPSEIEPDEIIFSIDGEPIPMSIFRYHLYDSFSRLENRYMTNELDFGAVMGEDMSLGQYILKNSIDAVKFNMAVDRLAGELNIDRASAAAGVDEYLSSTIAGAFGGDEDAFREQLSLMGTTLESFRKLMIYQSLGGQAYEHYFGESWVSSVDPSAYYDQFATASNILLFTVSDELDGLTGERVQTPLGDDEIKQKRELADDLLERLKRGGEDFFKLLDEYGEDPSVMVENNPERKHTFQRNDRIYDYAVAVFSTEVGGYSDVVETPHGYYIIYRLPLDTETVAEAIKTQAFRSDLFSAMLDELSRDYIFEATALFENSSLENWYREYKGKNFQMF